MGLQVYSNVQIEQIYSEEVDYAEVNQEWRLIEDGQPRNLEDENKRLIE